MEARAECVREIPECQAPVRRRENIDEDLVADAGEVVDRAFEHLALGHEEAAHRIGKVRAQNGLGEPCRDEARELAETGEAFRKLLLGVAAADDDFGLPAFEHRQHLGQQRLVVLQIGVDDRDVGRRGGEHSFA